MKKSMLLIAFVAIVTGLFATEQSKAKKDSKATGTETVVFVADLHCKSCVAKIEKNIPYEKGVKGLKVNEADKTIAITYSKDKNNANTLKAAIEKLDVKVLGLKGECAATDCNKCPSQNTCTDKNCKDKKCTEKEHKH
ncbi:MAG: cation transporter [Marinifilaceae bacterium]